jgi:two-component system cell cycle response regulator DivK
MNRWFTKAEIYHKHFGTIKDSFLCYKVSQTWRSVDNKEQGQNMDGAKILYIEDNVENRTLVKRVLEVEGYVVLEADDGIDGLRVVREEAPDLILIDINLPEIDGYEITTRLRQMEGLNNIPIVALTANVLKGDRERSLEAGCDGYIQKPIDVDLLPAQIAAFLRQARQQ